MRTHLLAALFQLGVATGLVAQTVRGTVVDASDQPIGGVVVTLVNEQSRDAARALTNDRGEFRLTAPAPGSYRLRALRIGFRPTLSDTFVVAGTEVQQRLRLTQVAFTLDAITARDRNACRVVAADSTSTMFAAWEQVRGALTATRLSLGTRNMLATTMGYTQMLDLKGRVADQTADIRTDFLQQPWRSLSPDSVRKSGYVFTEAGDIRTYNAPGIDVLLSETFLEDHCLRVASGSDARQLGIAFEPTPDRSRIAEIRGTLWLDRGTSELRRLEYRYVNVSRDEERLAGGDMSFVRMQNGHWVIGKWNIRMPTIVLVPVYKGLIVVAQEQRVDSIKVEGGEIVTVVSAIGGRRDTVWTRPAVVLSGIVLDSVSGKPVSTATVTLPATKQSAATDAVGHFAIPGTLPGRYQLEIRTPSLDSMRLAHVVPVLFTDSSVALRLRVPNAAQILGSVCPGSNFSQRSQPTGVIVGSVNVSGDSTVRADVRVTARWNVVTMKGPITDRPPVGDEGWHTKLPNIYGEPRITDTRTDSAGVFRLCDVPTGTDLTIQAIVDTSMQGFRRIRLPDAQRMARVDFTIDPSHSTAATFTGTVRDSSGARIPDAEVLVPELGLQARTDGLGAFRIGEVIPGGYAVVVRKLGYGSLEARLDFSPSQTTDRTVVLSRVTVLDSMVTEASMLWREAPLLREFEENRKIGLGKFYTRADLEMARGRSMTTFFEIAPGFQAITLNGGRWIKSSRTRSINPHCYELEDAIPPIPPGINCGCFPIVFLDFQRLNDERRVPNINRFRADELEAIEFYRSGAETPPRYTLLNSECGVIVLHSRRSK